MGLSIRTKLLLAIGLPLLAAYLGMVWCEYVQGRREALAAMKAHLAELAGRHAAGLDAGLSRAEELARTLATAVSASPELSPGHVHALLRDSLGAHRRVFGMCTAFEPGALPGAEDPFAPYYCRDGEAGALRYVNIAEVQPDYARLDWYAPARTGHGPYWTEPYFDAGIGERLMCTYSVPIVREGKLLGVQTVDVLSSDLLRAIERTRIGSGYCALVSRKGTFISHPDASLVMHESVFSLAAARGIEELAVAGREMTAGRAGTCRVRDYATGRSKWMVFAPVKTAGWSLAAMVPEDEVMAPIHARLFRSMAVLAAGLVVILGSVVLVSARVTRPIARLAEAAARVARGDLEARVAGGEGRDEVGQLVRSFNAMTVRLKANIEARIAQETARKEIEGELKAARAVQASLLPAMLAPDEQRGFSLHAVNAPAKLVAGDFFDFFYVDRARLALVMADVSGKGTPAAMYMAVVRTRLRDLAASDRGPAETVAALNRRLVRENDRGMFVTLFYGLYNVESGDLVYANGGHNPPYIIRQAGSLETLEPTGPIVGPLAGAVFGEARRRLDPGDLLVLFTDGVTEAGVDGAEAFGEERLERLLRSLPAGPAAEVCQAVLRAAGDFAQGEFSDDATVLALRRTGRILVNSAIVQNSAIAHNPPAPAPA